MQVQNHGSIALILPTTAAEAEWLEEHLDPDGPQWGSNLIVGPDGSYWAPGRAVEPRYLGDILAGAEDAGFTLEGVKLVRK